MFSLTHSLTDKLIFYGSLSSTLNFFNLKGWIQNFMGQVGNMFFFVFFYDEKVYIKLSILLFKH